MWLPNAKGSTLGEKGGRNGLVAVAIDKDKGSQLAIKWAIDNLLAKCQTVVLIHVVQRSAAASHGGNYPARGFNGAASPVKQELEKQTKDLFLTFHCFCTRKDILCLDVVLEDTDISRAITDYVAHAAIESLVLGASHHGFIRKLKMVDVPSSVSKSAPDFCTVFVISKAKVSSVRNASRIAPFTSPLMGQIQQMQREASNKTPPPSGRPRHTPSMRDPERTPPRKSAVDEANFKSPILARGYNPNMFDLPDSDTDISFISCDRPSTDRLSDATSVYFDGLDSGRTSRVSISSESSFGSMHFGTKGSEMSSLTDFSRSSLENDDVDSEMRRLKLELQKTMEMYSTACREALSAKQKTVELHEWRKEEERRLEEARLAEEAARIAAEQEKVKYKAAMQNAQVAQRIAELESHKRVDMENKSQGSDDRGLSMSQLRYRRYTIKDIEEATENFAQSRKIGEGGYGPVYRCYLDHTSVAIKVLRPDAAQGRSQFQQEVEVLSCLRHPNLVLLLGACPEYGCLVYEYMSNGSLDDCLFRKQNTRPLSWQLRFRIAAEIATGLNFLHQTKPKPLVHRDLKPGNILLDKNYVSKISDVGLARLVPQSVVDNVTEYRMTSAAGTLCYIDPEYQQTGMLGVQSDIYSLGIMLLQIVTAKPAIGIAHHIGRAIEDGSLAEMLDPCVPDWPVEETLTFVKLAVQCAEFRKKDRPDLGKIVVPELNRLRDFGEQSMSHFFVGGSAGVSPNHGYISTNKVVRSDPQFPNLYSNVNGIQTSASLPEQLVETTK